MSRVVAGVETDYIYDLSGRVVADYGGGCGATCWRVGYIYLNGAVVAEYFGGTYFVHTDHLGSTRLLTGYPTASVVECDDYYPFGEQISCGGTSTTTHKFTGYERDPESGLDNAQARYNSSSLGRFMSPDPLGNFVADATNPQTWNLYTYVVNNPLTMTDPSGMDYGCNLSWDNPCGGFEGMSGAWNLNEEWSAETSPAGSGQGGAPQVPCADDPNCTFQDTMNGTWWDTVYGPQNQNYGGAVWDNYALHAAFGGNYYNLPGYGDPVAQALEQYNKQVAQAQYNAVLQAWEQSNLIAGPGPQGKPPLSQRLLKYLTQYVPCAMGGGFGLLTF